MHKFKLDFDDDYEFLLFGISCHLKDYRVAWYLNKQLKLDLVRNEVALNTSKNEHHVFSIYKSADEANRLTYYLLDNYSEEFSLVKNLKQYDFFVIVEGYIDLFDEHEFIMRLKQVDHLQMVAQEDPVVLKKFQYSLFES